MERVSTRIVLNTPRHLRDKWVKSPHQVTQSILSYGERFALPPQRVVSGLVTYVVKKSLIRAETAETDLETLLHFLESFGALTDGIDFYKSNAFRYLHEGADLSTTLNAITANTEFWVQRFGADFFARYHDHSKERACLLRADIDEDYYLSCKAGGGMGTFALDFAIGIKGREFAPNIPVGELWRSGIDTGYDGDKTQLRIIRSGSGVKGDEAKAAAFSQFKKRYRTTPQRLLALLALYIGKDLGVDSVLALTSEGVRSKGFTQLGHDQVSFDYTGLFKGVGFEPSDNPYWLEVENPSQRLYDYLKCPEKAVNGLRRCDAWGLDRVMTAFRSLADVTGTGKSCALTVVSDQTREAVEAAIVLHRYGY